MKNKKTLAIIFGLLILVIATGGYLYLSQKKSPEPSTNAAIAGRKDKTSHSTNNIVSVQAKGGQHVSENAGKQATGPMNTPGASLTPPTGEFVSNHSPSLSSNTANESSVCNVTPGATCFIQFINNGTIESLPPETAGSSGSVDWNWKLQNLHIIAGTWTITAVASKNGQTMSSNDSLNMTVSR